MGAQTKKSQLMSIQQRLTELLEPVSTETPSVQDDTTSPSVPSDGKRKKGSKE